jgi:uncharacterized protein YndB with AHSA1/START domain
MKKDKFHIEYSFAKVSKTSLWNYLTTPDGLASWFADDVVDKGKIFSFAWEDYASDAEILGINPFVYIRFRWIEEDVATYFEFRMHRSGITGDWMLEITDFSEKSEKVRAVILWDTQIKVLKRRLGLLP